METSERTSDGVSTLREGSLDAMVDDEGVVLVEFYTDWCPTCARMDPLLRSIAADTAATVLKVDVEDHLETAIEYGAQRTPTFVCFVDGRPVKQLHGGQTREALRNLIDRYAP